MAYTTLNYYKTTWRGLSNSDVETQKYIDRAADDIDIMTNYEIDISTLTANQLLLLQKANCAQAEFYIKNGEDGLNGGSLSIGSFSISDIEKSNDTFSDIAFKYLSASGVYFAGVNVCNRFRENC